MRKFLSIFVLTVAFVSGVIFGSHAFDEEQVVDHHVSKLMMQTSEREWAYLDEWQYKQREPIYIFLDNYFLGAYRKDTYNYPRQYGWSSWDKVGGYLYLRDLAVAPSFKLYDGQSLVGESKQLILRNSELMYDDATWTTLTQWAGVGAEEETITIDLPTSLHTPSVQKLSLPQRNAVVYFAKDEWERDVDYVLATNSTHDPRPKRVKQGGELPEEYRQYFREIFKREGMGDVPLVMTDHYRFDADGDGKDEHIIILQNTTTTTSRSERDKKNYGLYSYAFYADGERIQTIYKNKLLCSGREAIDQTFDVTLLEYLKPIGVYDLNGDGKLEWCMDIGGWEWGTLAVYTLDDENKYRSVLRSQYGM